MEGNADPALQVIILGSGGGPQESNVTAFLVRAVAEKWSKGSIVAVDAGVHLSAVTRLIQEAYPSPPPTQAPFTLTKGPFAGLELPFVNVGANAAHITRSLVDTYLITHPHLDHISGFVVNTAGLPGTRPKKLAGLPSTIQAFKNHIFNNVIWPNLSDENNGAGLLTYLRLVEGGSPALGDGDDKGYLEVCGGLLAKTWSVSHGHCIERHHAHRGSASSASVRLGSNDTPAQTPRRDWNHRGSSQTSSRGSGLLGQAAAASLSASSSPPHFGSKGDQDKICVYDSSAYFIQDDAHRREVLIFGDVEPDSLSLSPRNLNVWQEAAPKIAAGILAAIFIECSYDDSQSNDRLFGHLKPFFVMEELRSLADEVERTRERRGGLDPRKRKRSSTQEMMSSKRNVLKRQESDLEKPLSPKSMRPTRDKPDTDVHIDMSIYPPAMAATAEEEESSARELTPRRRSNEPWRPLEGLKVILIHVKERLDDGSPVGERILRQLQAYEAEMDLGCEFILSQSGMSFYF